MNKKAQAHLHGHYTGDIPFGIWVLIVSIVCIVIGKIFDQGSLFFIGVVLLILWIGVVVITFLREMGALGSL